ncbi:MAG: NAD(+)/NADH kinase [Thaumarchaeota archaeon]|nr:NAD(+)/NADH kinase [Nitrososphaerota archaeon]
MVGEKVVFTTRLYTVLSSSKNLPLGNAFMPKVGSVALVAKQNDRNAETVSSRLADALIKASIETMTVEPLSLPKIRQVSEAEASDVKTDAVVAVGGDGTVLRSFRIFDNHTPVLGVNVGGRGVMAEATPDHLEQIVKRLREGDFTLEKRLKLMVSNGSKTYPPAANDVYLTRVSKTRTPTYRIMFHKTDGVEQRMDGVLIATPTGSTAHSLSAGGPIVSGDLEVFLVTPVCPISRMPPLIVPAGVVEISASEPTNLVIDGYSVFPIEPNTVVKVSKHGSPAVFIRFENRPLRQLSNLGFR